MDLKKIGKAILFPNIAVMIILVPVSTAFLVCSMLFIGTESIIAIISYVLSAYTLTVWCLKIPYLIRFFKKIKNENKFAKRWSEDTRLRVSVSLYVALAFNAMYALFQLWLGFYHKSFWFYSLGAYYICLGAMRFFLVNHTKKYAPGEKMRIELIKYRNCGWIFLLMNLALALIVFFMIYWNRTFRHHMITAIAMAAYTFFAFTLAIVNVIKYKKYNSPVFFASKAISLAAACVSMLTLTSTMLTTFGDGTIGTLEQKIMLGSVGGVVSGAVVVMAVFIIIKCTKRLKQLKIEDENGE